MGSEIRKVILGAALAIGACGCAGSGEVRYVYQDGTSGVIGLPENSSRWPTYYRRHAETLMAKHFPEGFEIVRAEEVVEGARTVTVHGTNALALDPGGGRGLITIAKVGRTAERSRSDTLKIKECRIIYKKAGGPEPVSGSDYASQASWTPTPYVDPNAEERRVVARPVPPSPPAHIAPAL